MSTAFAVVVRDRDEAPPGKRNAPPAHATVRPAVASLVKMSVKDEPRFELALEFVNVKVQLPVSVAEKTFPCRKSMLVAVPELPSATTRSE